MAEKNKKDEEILGQLYQNYRIKKNYLFAGERYMVVNNEEEAMKVNELVKDLNHPKLVDGILIKRNNPLQKYELFTKRKEMELKKEILKIISSIRKKSGQISFQVENLRVNVEYRIINKRVGTTNGKRE